MTLHEVGDANIGDAKTVSPSRLSADFPFIGELSEIVFHKGLLT